MLKYLIVGSLFSLTVYLYYVIVRSKSKKSGDFIASQENMNVITGSPGDGKTTLLAKMAAIAKERKEIVISNFFCGDADIYWSSKDDLLQIFKELQFLGHCQNYTRSERKRMWARYGKEWNEATMAKIDAFSKAYPNIPVFTKFNSRFLLLGDEMYNYFHSRENGNFRDMIDKDDITHEYSLFLNLFNQIRHMNTFAVFATQFDMDLDVKFRRSATYLIKTTKALGGLLKCYWAYYYVDDEKAMSGVQGSVSDQTGTGNMIAATNFPAIFFNGYVANQWFSWFFRMTKIKWRFGELDFYSKDDVLPKISVYKKNSIYSYLNAYYADEKKKKELKIS